jgi:hypothetical protein
VLCYCYSSTVVVVLAPNEHYNSTNKPFYTIHCYSNFKKNQPLQHRRVTAGWWMKFEKQAVIFFSTVSLLPDTTTVLLSRSPERIIAEKRTMLSPPPSLSLV